MQVYPVTHSRQFVVLEVQGDIVRQWLKSTRKESLRTDTGDLRDLAVTDSGSAQRPASALQGKGTMFNHADTGLQLRKDQGHHDAQLPYFARTKLLGLIIAKCQK